MKTPKAKSGRAASYQLFILPRGNESRRSMKNRLTGRTEIPNFLGDHYFDVLAAVKTAAIRGIR